MQNNALELRNICFQIGSRKILNNVSFSVKPSSVHGFLGPNGAGKSTTMRIITGVISKTSGEVKVFDQDMSTSAYELKNLIGFLPENPPLYEDMTVVEYLRFMAKLRGHDSSSLDYVIERLDIKDVQNRLVGNLSRGYKQRVGFAQALVHNPKLIILDEPTLGLDPHAIVYMRELIQELSSDHTILLSSHQLSEVEKICDEVSFIKDGSILASGDLQSLQENIQGKKQKILIQAYGITQNLEIKLRELNYIEYVYAQIKDQDQVSTLEVDIQNGHEAQLVQDLVRYGCSPVEIKAAGNLENYFLQEVGR